MKHILKTVIVIMIASVAITSCKKEVKEVVANSEISESALSKISEHGFGTSNVQKVDEGYLVEGDIILTEEFLNSAPGGNLLRIGNTEQYRTTNLVNVSGGVRNITISASSNGGGGISANLSAGIDLAITRYNAENLLIKMSRVSSGGDINIKIVNGGSYIASSGFPTGGKPYNTVNYNKQYQNYSVTFIGTVISHEVGHCIGFRHTDYMDRSISCGGSPTNEGASNVGAIFIPGTNPGGNDPGSWMLSCLSANTNRPFNANDKTALNFLY